MTIKSSGLSKAEIDALRCWVSSISWDYYIVLSPNKNTRNGDVRANSDFLANRMSEIRHWHAKSDRQLLGKRWAKSPNRTFFVGFPEIGPESGLLHFNLLVQSPRNVASAVRAYEQSWIGLFKSGGDVRRQFLEQNSVERPIARQSLKKLDLLSIAGLRRDWSGEIEIKPPIPGEIEELTSYNSKKLWTQLGSDGWFFSEENHTRTPRVGATGK
jgi:hypothetical protein